MPQHGPWLNSHSFLLRQAWVPLCLGPVATSPPKWWGQEGHIVCALFVVFQIMDYFIMSNHSTFVGPYVHSNHTHASTFILTVYNPSRA